YHRFPLLDRETQAVGYGEAQIGILAAAVMDVGIGDPTKAQPVVFPAAGARDVPAGFVGHETPDPAPAGTQYPVGYPVTLTVGSASTFSVQSSRLLTADGNEVTGFTLLPGRQVDAGEWCFMAQAPPTRRRSPEPSTGSPSLSTGRSPSQDRNKAHLYSPGDGLDLQTPAAARGRRRRADSARPNLERPRPLAAPAFRTGPQDGPREVGSARFRRRPQPAPARLRRAARAAV